MCLSEPQDSQCPSSRPPQQGTLTDTDNDIKSSLTTVSIISFDSLASSSSPLAERAIIFESGKFTQGRGEEGGGACLPPNGKKVWNSYCANIDCKNKTPSGQLEGCTQLVYF